MDGLTIKEAQRYAGYTRPTWLGWLNNGQVKGEKGEGSTDSWFIPRDEVERIRLEALTELQEKIDKLSTPVPPVPKE